MNVFEIKDAWKSFDGEGVLRGISMAVKKGEVVALIGPSGSGKSTLLRCATGLETMESGNIIYNGKFGLVFQNYNLFPHFSVLKNITDAPENVLGLSKAEAEEKAMGILRKLGLEEKANAYPCQLSGGQKQRVAIARALAMDPDMLFFDEPTAALDPELTAEVLKVIKELAAEKMTMLIVTHEINFAKNVADRMIFMADGKIIEEGTPDEILNHSQTERLKTFLEHLEE